jgi:hypothetical protein
MVLFNNLAGEVCILRNIDAIPEDLAILAIQWIRVIFPQQTF